MGRETTLGLLSLTKIVEGPLDIPERRCYKYLHKRERNPTLNREGELSMDDLDTIHEKNEAAVVAANERRAARVAEDLATAEANRKFAQTNPPANLQAAS